MMGPNKSWKFFRQKRIINGGPDYSRPKTKCPPHVTSDHAEMVYFLRQSEFRDQDI